MEDAGAVAVVLVSLFEEQLALESKTLDDDLSRGTDSYAESLGYLPDLDDYRMTQEVYLNHLRNCKEAVKIPILASLNGATTGGWVRFAKDVEQAGADAIELNTYALATDKSQTSAVLEGSYSIWSPPSPRRSRFRFRSSSCAPSPASRTWSPSWKMPAPRV